MTTTRNLATLLEMVPKSKYTIEEIMRIDRALEKTKGHQMAAAEILGVPKHKIRNAVRDLRYLRQKWGHNLAEPIPENEIAELDRQPVTAFDDEVAAAMDRQDALIARTKGKLPGFTENEQAWLLKLTRTYSEGFKMAADLAHSGAVHSNARLLTLMEQLKERADDILNNPSRYDRVVETQGGVSIAKSANDYYKETVDQIIKVAEALRKAQESVLKGAETRLKIEKFKQDQADKAPKKVAGWAPGETLDADTTEQ